MVPIDEVIDAVTRDISAWEEIPAISRLEGKKRQAWASGVLQGLSVKLDGVCVPKACGWSVFGGWVAQHLRDAKGAFILHQNDIVIEHKRGVVTVEWAGLPANATGQT